MKEVYTRSELLCSLLAARNLIQLFVDWELYDRGSTAMAFADILDSLEVSEADLQALSREALVR